MMDEIWASPAGADFDARYLHHSMPGVRKMATAHQKLQRLQSIYLTTATTDIDVNMNSTVTGNSIKMRYI